MRSWLTSAESLIEKRFLLVHALREGIPADLLSQKRGSTASERRLTKRLQKRYGVSDKAAQWAVESWSEALHHAAPDTASKPPGEKRTNPEKVLGRLSPSPNDVVGDYS